MFLVLHSVGNQNVRSLLKALKNEDLLHSFHTSIAYFDHGLNFLLPRQVKQELLRRNFDSIDKAEIKSYPFFDICRLVAQKAKINSLTNVKTGFFRPENTNIYVDKKAAEFLHSKDSKGVSAVYSYDGKCLETFKAAKRKGSIKTVYEAAYGYAPEVMRILKEEIELNGRWEDSIPQLSDENLNRQIREVELADQIIVASEFAKKTFSDAGIDKEISVVPYSAPPVVKKPDLLRERNKNAKLSVIYVGALSQQKGLSYLFDAMSTLSPDSFSLNLIGRDYSFGKNEYLPLELNKHSWQESLPNLKVLDAMSCADVLVLPSVSEAFGLVVLEAMSRGLPVIVSRNCGASDIVEEGVNGFVVPVRDSQTIAAKLRVLNDNRDLLSKMREAAYQTASNYDLSSYSSNLLKAINVS